MLGLLLASCLASEKRCKDLVLDCPHLVDEDGDGCPLSVDCDDRNPNECQDFQEIPYDGFDNDCDGGDLLDMDGDGFVPFTEQEYFDEFPDTDQDWPAHLQEGDCHDLDDEIFPGGDDVFYDGLDGDCAGDNDFDADGDGIMPPADAPLDGGVTVLEAFETFLLLFGYDLEAVYGDCDDDDPDIGVCN